jgi:putative flippase GtrA
LERNTVNNNNRRVTLVQFIKFGVVGLSNTAVAYAVYYPLVYVNLHYLAASVISFIVCGLNAFFWNNKYVFKCNGDQKRDIWGAIFKMYASYALTGLVLQNILLFVLIDVLAISKYIAPILCLAMTIPLNFVLNKKWAFKA